MKIKHWKCMACGREHETKINEKLIMCGCGEREKLIEIKEVKNNDALQTK